MSAPRNDAKIAALMLTVAGIGCLASAMVINPWVGHLYRPDMIPYRDVMAGYGRTAVLVGVVLLAYALTVRRHPRVMLINASLPVLIVAGIVVSDRLLLARSGLPLWEPDAELHYRHRPNAVRSWGGPFDGRIRINQYGFHDDRFPREKPDGEFRAIVLGNSVTMGHGLEYPDTFTNQLEAMLKARSDSYSGFQMINTGVQGYSTFQELVVLRRTLSFAPDAVIVGFCLNDVTEPFLVNERFGGSGIDYHDVRQSGNVLLGYLMNETGYGRLLRRFQERNRELAHERDREEFNVRQLASRPIDDEEFREPWRIVLSYLEDIYDLAHERALPVVLVIFPYTFQLGHEDLQEPQRILRAHAERAGVDVIDMTPTFEHLIEHPDSDLVDRSPTERVQAFFLDADHFTARGHRVVANRLMDFLVDVTLVSRRP